MKEKKIPVLSCAVVRDLLPLYIDGEVTEVTSKAMKQHIIHCPACTLEENKLSQELPLASDILDGRKGFERMVKKNKKNHAAKTLLSFLAGAAVLFVLLMILRPSNPKWDISCFQPFRIEHYRFTDCPFSKPDSQTMHSEGDEDEGLFIFMNAPAVPTYEIKRKDGNVDMVYTHPIFGLLGGAEVYAKGTEDQIFIVPVQPGDRTFSINGTVIYDIGEPQTGSDLPDYVRAYHYSRNSGGKAYFELGENDEITGIPSLIYGMTGEDRRIEWTAEGKVISDTMGSDKEYMIE